MPPSTQNIFLFLSLLPIVCLNFEQPIAGISISIHFRTVVANSNNFQTHSVCDLLSTNEINPSENIFNSNVMQNAISNIVKSGRLNQFLLKSGRLQLHYVAHGVEYTPIYSQQSVTFGGKQDSLIGLRLFRGGADSNLNVPRGGGGGAPCRRQIPTRWEEVKFYDLRGTS